MSDHDGLSDHRKAAIELAKSFGWHVSRKGRKWHFTQPDTGGLWDAFEIGHNSLSTRAVLRKLEAYEPELALAVRNAVCAAQDEWLAKRRPTWRKLS